MGLIVVDYRCEPCGVSWESIEERPAPARVLHVACGKKAERIMSAAKARVVTVPPTPVSRGKSDPPPSHRSVDTRPIADGTKLKDWRASRREMWRAERRAQVKRELS